MGAPPRYLGSNEACTLIAPKRGALSRDSGSNWPNAAVTIKSASNVNNSSSSSEPLSFQADKHQCYVQALLFNWWWCHDFYDQLDDRVVSLLQSRHVLQLTFLVL